VGFGPATITLPMKNNNDLTEFKQWLVATSQTLQGVHRKETQDC